MNSPVVDSNLTVVTGQAGDGDMMGEMLGDCVEIVHENGLETTCSPHVLLSACVLRVLPFSSKRESLADDRRHKQPWISVKSLHHLFKMTTLSISTGFAKSIFNQEFASAVWENVVLLPSMALDAANLRLLFNVDD